MLAQLAVALLLAGVVEIVIEHFVGKPLEIQLPKVSRWWLIYVALVGGGVLAWFCNVNLLVDMPQIPAMVGRIVSAVLVGGGSQLVHHFLELAKGLSAKYQ